MSVYQSNPDKLPDSVFEPGTVEHLVEGNTGRLLDPRRTPVTLVGIDVSTGMFTVRLEDFEDAGALWHVPFEKINGYQFARGSARAPMQRGQHFRQAIERFDLPLRIHIDSATARATQLRIDAAQALATTWLEAHSRFLKRDATLPDPRTRQGDSHLQQDLQQYMHERGVLDIEQAVSEGCVRNPHSGEMIKAHRIVLAELGLAAFEGTVIRDETVLARMWSRQRRTDHIVQRFAFLRALFGLMDVGELLLFRGCYSDVGQLLPPINQSFVSTTTNIDVARSHFDADTLINAALYRQRVPIERVFMSYYETAEMNQHFLEAEVVLLHDPGNTMF